ncbi:hypothetical protein PGTUg99_025361 [Puccinia graminis f. sp. tritici]|uniref:Uncharacterized protein n=1 Tax=Puccinia graminis f. sp. tritici TaxID=56615 RepID=A0A5B0P2C1_PUCGR|nr:hypothetical protein PGTUg99_025361 [Puccinia graminis f. sp. tritici]
MGISTGHILKCSASASAGVIRAIIKPRLFHLGRFPRSLIPLFFDSSVHWVVRLANQHDFVVTGKDKLDIPNNLPDQIPSLASPTPSSSLLRGLLIRFSRTSADKRPV